MIRTLCSSASDVDNTWTSSQVDRHHIKSTVFSLSIKIQFNFMLKELWFRPISSSLQPFAQNTLVEVEKFMQTLLIGKKKKRMAFLPFH